MSQSPSPNPTPPRKPASSQSQQRRRRSSRPRQAVSPEESQLQKWELARHDSRRKQRRGKPQIGQLNLTSMIDVIFLLLIYFVITANFVEDEGVLIAKLPSGSGPTDPVDLPPQNIDITLTSFDETGVIIEVGAQRLSSFKELTAHLKGISNNPAKGFNGYADLDSPIIIRPGGDVRWNHVVNAFNSSVSSDYTNVSFAQTGGGQG